MQAADQAPKSDNASRLLLGQSHFYWAALAIVVMLAYGYEIFGFHLTIDEELVAIEPVPWRAWISHGRWAMAILNAVVVPTPVVPTVSTLLGVFLAALALTLIVRDSVQESEGGALAAVAVAISAPTLAFTVSFSTLAYVAGAGFLAVAFSNRLIRQASIGRKGMACFAGAFAVATYQPFLFALMAVALDLLINGDGRRDRRFLHRFRLVIGYVLGSIAVYAVVAWLAVRLFAPGFGYVGQFIDIVGFLKSPGQHIAASAARTFQVIALDPRYFGLHSGWQIIALAMALAASCYFPFVRREYAIAASTFVGAAGLLLLVLSADVIAAGGAPLRSMVYLPVAVALIIGRAYSVSGDAGRRLLISACCLAVIGNAQITNHLFASSVSAEFRDRMLAQTIMDKVSSLEPQRSRPLRLEVVGYLAWPPTALQTSSDSIGASFFQWDYGNRYRIASYLSLRGLNVLGATQDDRVFVHREAMSMPSWPADGWLRVIGDVLVLKFGPYSVPQATGLCASGVRDLCNK